MRGLGLLVSMILVYPQVGQSCTAAFVGHTKTIISNNVCKSLSDQYSAVVCVFHVRPEIVGYLHDVRGPHATDEVGILFIMIPVYSARVGVYTKAWCVHSDFLEGKPARDVLPAIVIRVKDERLRLEQNTGMPAVSRDLHFARLKLSLWDIGGSAGAYDA